MSYHNGGAAYVVVVLWKGTVLFVNLISDVDSLPMVEGRSDVGGVCASTMSKGVDISIVENIIASALANKTK